MDALAGSGEDCGHLRAHIHLDGQLSFSSYISTAKAEDWFDVWRLINEQRMGRYEWSSYGPNIEQDSLHPTIAFFRTIAERNQSRARRRLLRARRLNSQDDAVEVLENDVHHVDPSDDEGIPPESQDVPLNLPTYFSLPLSSLDPSITVRSVKRPCDTVESGFTKEPRTERGSPQQDVNIEDYGIFP